MGKGSTVPYVSKLSYKLHSVTSHLLPPSPQTPHTHTHIFTFKNTLPPSQPKTKLFIDGEMVDSKTDRWIDNYNPATQEIVSHVPCATLDEMNLAVEAAKRAFPEWRERSVMARQNVMFQLRQLIKENMVIIILYTSCVMHFIGGTWLTKTQILSADNIEP